MSAAVARPELLEHVAEREYALLRALEELDLPVVEPISCVQQVPMAPVCKGST